MAADEAPSLTAQRVAAYRLGMERLAAPFGDPAADQRFTADVAGSASVDLDGRMGRYLRGRTTAFDRVVINALDRGARQVLSAGAGYDGRSLRYRKADVRWFEVDRPVMLADKQERLTRLGIDHSHITFVGADLGQPGWAASVAAAGWDPDASSVMLCEGVAVYLDEDQLTHLLDELRSLVTVGTRLALSLSTRAGAPDQAERRERFEQAVAAMGEPARSRLTPDDADDLLARTRWQKVELSERAARVGLLVAAPVWVPGAPPTAGRLGRYLERTFHRDGLDDLAAHLHAAYGIEVAGVRPLDVGVCRVNRLDGEPWIARVFPAERSASLAAGDAALLTALAAAGFPAEEPACPDAVSTLAGQAVLVTALVPGEQPKPTAATFEALGGLLGRLHAGAADVLSRRPGGGWHHLVDQGTQADEVAAALDLLDAASGRVAIPARASLGAMRDHLESLPDGADLPQALAHPDFVPANAIATPDGNLTMVDWTGAGWEARIWPLGFLLWAASAARLALAEAVMQGYRAHVRLTAEELRALPVAIRARAHVLDAWAFATGRQPLDDTVARFEQTARLADAIAAQARGAI